MISKYFRQKVSDLLLSKHFSYAEETISFKFWKAVSPTAFLCLSLHELTKWLRTRWVEVGIAAHLVNALYLSCSAEKCKLAQQPMPLKGWWCASVAKPSLFCPTFWQRAGRRSIIAARGCEVVSGPLRQGLILKLLANSSVLHQDQCNRAALLTKFIQTVAQRCFH